jgi:hypothetical protein
MIQDFLPDIFHIRDQFRAGEFSKEPLIDPIG